MKTTSSGLHKRADAVVYLANWQQHRCYVNTRYENKGGVGG